MPDRSQRQPALALDIALTARCPLRCRFCSVDKREVPELSAGEWRAVIGEFARRRPIELISLEGGEPLTRPDLPEILAASLEHASQVKLVTSGAVPTIALPIDLARNPRFTLEVSVDGPQPVHDFLRDGSYAAAWRFIRAALARGIRLRLRSVVSAFNIECLEDWLGEVDLLLERCQAEAGYRFDTIIAPEALKHLGGPAERLGLRAYDSRGLVPAPHQIHALYERLRRRSFGRLRLEQTEPFRGCGAGRVPAISFDPSGRFSFCCEVAGSFGSILALPPSACLRILDDHVQAMPCRSCDHLEGGRCDGCWTGQKCGLVGHWKAPDCSALLNSVLTQRQRATGP